MVNNFKICLVGTDDAHKRVALARHLIQHGFEVTIMGTKVFKCPPEIEFLQYKLNRKLNLVSDFYTVLAYNKTFREREFDIIQTFDTKPAFLVPLATRRNKDKVVRTITGLGTIFMSSSLKSKLLRTVHRALHLLVQNKVAHTTFQNKNDLEVFRKRKLITEQTSSLIYGSGIDLSVYDHSEYQRPEKFTFICIGRLVFEKGIINYIEAAKKCIQQGFPFKYVLVGPLEENSRKLNARILEEYKDYVQWLGPRSDVPDLLRKSSAFVLPTYREGFSRVLLEASAFGLPSITTDVPGTREIVRHNKEGYLVPVNDSNELSKAMIQLASDKNQYKRFSENTKKHVAQFSIEQISSDYVHLYSRILDKKFKKTAITL
ncbi:MAG: glycosyltransferase family 4 protein [Bacteroidota bacterium]